MARLQFDRASPRGLDRRAALAAAVGLIAAATQGVRGAQAATMASPPLMSGAVGHVGDLRLIASGGLKASASLGPLLEAKSVYAIGMLAGLKGELLIRDSKAQLGVFDADRSYRVRPVTDGDLAFLVYAQVPAWVSAPLPATVADFRSLERHLPEAARAAGLDPDRPFPFMISARAVALKWFVVGGLGNGVPDPLGSFARAQTLGGLDDSDIEGVGFFSSRHRGVLTSPQSDMHCHFEAQPGSRGAAFVGHLNEQASFAPGGVLKLPAPDWRVAL